MSPGFVLTPESATDASLVLSDGEREMELIGMPPGIYLAADPPFEAPLAANENSYVSSPDQEGGRRIRSKPLNGEGRGAIYVEGETAISFWDSVDDFLDLVAAAHRAKGWLRWSAPNAEALTFDLEAIWPTAFPQNRLLGQQHGKIEFEFTCLPYGRLDPEVIETAEVISGPIDSFEVDVAGHVAALAELTLSGAEDFDLIEVCVEQLGYDPDDPAPLLIDSDDLVTIGLAGAQATQAGAYDPVGGNNVVRATLSTTPVVVASTGPQPHIGRKKVRARLYASATGVRVRLAWRVGDGPFTYEHWVDVPRGGDFYEPVLATITIDEVPSGTHSWEGYIEGVADDAGTTLDIDYVSPLPAEIYGKARTPPRVDTPASFSARDEFDQTAGDLGGKTAPIGGSWTTSGAATDLAVVAGASRNVQRSTSSDASNRVATLPLSLADVAVAIDFKWGTMSSAGTLVVNLRARTTGAKLILGQTRDAGGGIAISLTDGGGVDSYAAGGLTPDSWYTLTMAVLGDVLFGWLIPQGAPYGVPQIIGAPSASPAGTLGFEEQNSSTTTVTRTFDNFRAWVPTIDHVLHSGQSAKFLHDAALRENAAGTRYGRVPVFEGQHLRIPPSTRANRKTRIAIQARRLDLDSGLPSQGLTDGLTADLTVTPRVLLSSR